MTEGVEPTVTHKISGNPLQAGGFVCSGVASYNLTSAATSRMGSDAEPVVLFHKNSTPAAGGCVFRYGMLFSKKTSRKTC